ncbi:MAG: Arc family DNA-binding protein [Pseudomonadota bacterium]|nr:Arc family DNA-binding protein [Pseudomonadota bacterium]
MASVLIKNLPDALHRQLKLRAEQHHRSLNKEVIALIEVTLASEPAEDGLESAGGRRPLAENKLAEARQRRAARIVALRGKYENAVSSSEEYAARKAEEIALER